MSIDKLDKESQLLEYLYKEYVRLNELRDSYTKSSFDDFKLLGSIGVLLTWKPLADLADASAFIVLFGFLAILFIVTIIGTRDLLKQSLINYYLSQIQFYEEGIRRILDCSDTHTFCCAVNWESWSRQKHLPVTSRLYLLILLSITVLPIIVLVMQKTYWYAFIYFLSTLFSLGIYMNAALVLYGKSQHSLLKRSPIR